MANPRVAVFGATGGIGRAIVDLELQQGANILLSARPGERLDNLIAGLDTHKVVSLGCDLLDEAVQVEKCLDRLGAFERVYVVVGGGAIGSFSEQDAAAFEATIDLNLKAPARVVRALAPSLQFEARVVLINSIAGLQTFPGWSAYCAGKWGLRALTECWREEYRAQGIRFVSAFPYATDTGFWDAVPGRWERRNMMSADQVAHMVVAAACAEVVVEEIRFASPHGAL